MAEVNLGDRGRGGDDFVRQQWKCVYFGMPGQQQREQRINGIHTNTFSGKSNKVFRPWDFRSSEKQQQLVVFLLL